MAKKIELLHTTYDESGNIESQEVVHPLTSPNCIIMENGKTLDEVMGDGIATPTLTHEGTSFKVGVGDSNIEVVDGDVAGMTLKGQSYQNILPKPTTLIMETDEKEFKINDKIDSNIIIDDNIAEIATVKGKTIVNAVQEESGSEYTVLGEDLSGQSITHVKDQISSVDGMTLTNLLTKKPRNTGGTWYDLITINGEITDVNNDSYRIKDTDTTRTLQPGTYLIQFKVVSVSGTSKINSRTQLVSGSQVIHEEYPSNTSVTVGINRIKINLTKECNRIGLYYNAGQNSSATITEAMVFKYDDNIYNLDIPYFEGEKYFESNIKGVTLQGQTLVNTIQEPCKDDYVVLGADDGIEISVETGGCGTIEDTVQGGINGAVLEGQTLVNLLTPKLLGALNATHTINNGTISVTSTKESQWCNITLAISPLKQNTEYIVLLEDYSFTHPSSLGSTIAVYVQDGNIRLGGLVQGTNHFRFNTRDYNVASIGIRIHATTDVALIGATTTIRGVRILEHQEGMENWDIPYFEGMQSVKMPVLKTTGKNLFDVDYLVTNMYLMSIERVQDGVKLKANESQLYRNVHSRAFKVKSGKYYNITYTVENENPNNVANVTLKSITGANFPGFRDCAITGSGTVTKTFLAEDSGYVRPQLYAAMTTDNGDYYVTYTNVMISEVSSSNDVNVEYEPYQSSTVGINDYALNITQFEQGTFSESSPAGTPYRQTLPTGYMDIRLRSKSLFKISGNTIRGTLNVGYGIFFGFFKDGKYMAKYSSWMDSTSFSVDVPYECTEFCIILRKNISDDINVSEYDLIGLTLEQVVELRGIGDVKDELDLQTGKLTQRIGEVVLDGSKEWSSNALLNNGIMVYMCQSYTNGKIVTDNVVSSTLPFYNLDYLKGLATLDGLTDAFITTITSRGKINLAFKKPFSDLNQLKQYLSQNPITVQYQLATPIVKTIDLSVTDQDGNTIPHIQTQPTVTHITASSDYLIPTVTIDNNLAYDTIIKPSTLYTVRFKRGNVNADNPLTVDLGGTTQTATSTEFTITTPSTLTHSQLVFSGKNNVVSEVQVIEGDVTGIEYPFFEGMNDVKFSDSQFIARGKNLLHVGKGYSTTSINGLTVIRNEVEQTITINGTCTLDNTSCALAPFYREFKKGERYAFSCKLISGTADRILFRANDEQWKGNISCGLKATSSNIYETCIKTFYSDETYNRSSIRVDSGATFNNAVFKVMLEKIPVPGDYTPQYEPYRGVEVQQDVDIIPLTSDMFEQNGWQYDKMIDGMTIQQFPTYDFTPRIRSKSMIKVKPNTTYTLNTENKFGNADGGWIVEFDKNGLWIGSRINDIYTFKTSYDTQYIALVFLYENESAISPSDLDSMNLILQEVPQEIVLRGIGNVKDELDLTRGEYIQRIGEVVLDGSKGSWAISTGTEVANDVTTLVHCYNAFKDAKPSDTTNTTSVVSLMTCDKYESKNIYGARHMQEGVTIHVNSKNGDCTVFIRIKAKLTTTAEVLNYFSNNPFKMQYQLATPIIHKVNLTNTKVIPSYATETHYETITPSDSLIPNITIPSTLNYDVAIKPSTEYTIRANTSDNLTVDLGGATGALSNGKVTLTTPATLTHNEVSFSGTGKVKELMVVEGSEIKDNVPFFNGMKDVQMGGIKLVNIARGATCNNLVTANTNKTQFTFTASTTNNAWGQIQFDKTLLKSNMVYTVMCDITTNTLINTPSGNCLKWQLGNANENAILIKEGFIGKFVTTVISPNDLIHEFGLFVINATNETGTITIQNPMIIEGDWTHLDEIPFIESEMIIEQPIIRSQGKNLFDAYNLKSQGGGTVTVAQNGSNYSVQIQQGSAVDYWQGIYVDIPMKKGETLQYHGKASGCMNARIFKDYNFFEYSEKGMVSYDLTSSTELESFELERTATEDCVFCCRLWIDLSKSTTIQVNNIQIEKSITATSYRAYRHQTLYSNRVIGYEEGVHYGYGDGVKYTNANYNSVMADVEGLSIAYVTNGSSNFTFWDKDGVYISGKGQLDTALSLTDKNGFITVPTNAKYMKFASSCSTGANTDYTKTTVTGELPLRSLPNGVCDTLNLVTGEYVQRVGEIVLDGSQTWSRTATVQSDKYRVYIRLNDIKSVTDNNIKNILMCDKYTNVTADNTYNLWKGISLEKNHGGGSALVIYDEQFSTATNNIEFQEYLSQNPITVQYELATPIVRKLGFTTKGNYREQVLDGSEEWAMDAIDNNKTVRMTKKTVSPLQNSLYNTPLFTDDYRVRAGDESHNTYEYITCIGNGIYINIYQSKVNELNVQGCTQWLSQNPIKVGYITSAQSSESYSNIHKPIFFNNVDVQFLPNNVDVQPKLTYQARTRNSYVMDMMKPNTIYTSRMLQSSNGSTFIDGTVVTMKLNNTFTSPSSLTDKLMITPINRQEFMIVEGDVTGKNLPYFKGILSSYHDVDEIEVYSVSKNLFDMSKVKPYDETGAHWWNTIIKENEVVSVRSGNIEAGQFGAYATLDIRPNSVYTLYIEMEKDGEPFNGQIYVYENDKVWGNGTFTGYANTMYHLRTSQNAKYITIGFNYGKDFPIGTTFVSKNMRLYLGEESPVYIPHAHNTTLIEMPTRLETVKVVRPVMENGSLNQTTGANYDDGDALVKNVRTKDYLPVQPSEIIKFYNNGQGRAVNIDYYDINKQFVKYEFYDGVSTRPTVPKDCYFVRMYCGKSACSDITLTRQAWKPIQLNSLPNGVYDEIIMKPNSNKAQLVQRVGKVVLNGSEDWSWHEVWSAGDIVCAYTYVGDKQVGTFAYSDKFEGLKAIDALYPQNTETGVAVKECIRYNAGTAVIYVFIKKARLGEYNYNGVKEYLKDNPLTVYYQCNPVTHEIQLKDYPHVYENGTVTLNTDISHQTLVSYNVNQEQLINTQNETIIRHDQQIDDLYYYIEMYLEEIYQMELFRMKLELSL